MTMNLKIMKITHYTLIREKLPFIMNKKQQFINILTNTMKNDIEASYRLGSEVS
ncbi:hypothetical protein PPL_03763 [Heterostelium album PN500]|uniref:Uncharacterized protein n=1 Tax=Heterostelium pallidum (strain ATCC 26659 / Pp 5 / PN500) TaxID=670386 RepID=D3B6L5_HETP5|nr:hypothetical protein PPL_03763 [Heterostelium album PN500]EFA82985.1 hypothetical protein PPL_03763 [Heterostelium album PN500]|eukprot:XP_020435102.1 hypothetical protein PPL_03763 [Heterostelium album PN500]